eukprot:6485638-Amphidinium_carterae.2
MKCGFNRLSSKSTRKGEQKNQQHDVEQTQQQPVQEQHDCASANVKVADKAREQVESIAKRDQTAQDRQIAILVQKHDSEVSEHKDMVKHGRDGGNATSTGKRRSTRSANAAWCVRDCTRCAQFNEHAHSASGSRSALWGQLGNELILVLPHADGGCASASPLHIARMTGLLQNLPWKRFPIQEVCCIEQILGQAKPRKEQSCVAMKDELATRRKTG